MKLLLYCTKAKPYLRDYRGKAIYDRFVISPTDRPFTSDDKQPILNGKIVAECDFEVEEILHADNCISYYCKKTTLLKEKSCLTDGQIYSYCKGNGYAIHIKNLHIFDKLRETKDYRTYNRNGKVHIADMPIYTAPQNMMYAFDYYGNQFVLISIQPQWLCKILNGEKTIEVRKKVLKEML